MLFLFQSVLQAPSFILLKEVLFYRYYTSLTSGLPSDCNVIRLCVLCVYVMRFRNYYLYPAILFTRIVKFRTPQFFRGSYEGCLNKSFQPTNNPLWPIPFWV